MLNRALVMAMVCAVPVGVAGQGQPQGAALAQAPATDTFAPGIPGVVAEGARVQVLRDDFQGTEGPIALPDGSMIFSEINANRTIRVDAQGNFTTFIEDTGGTTGVAFDSQGRLVAAVVPWGSTKFAVIHPASERRTIIDSYNGLPFGRPNDLAIANNGDMYFTDSANAQPRPPEGPPLPAAFYYLPAGATTAIQIATDIPFPNGVLLSLDERVLYLNTSGEHLIAFDRLPDGRLTNRRSFARYDGVTLNAAGNFASGADGLAIDSEGRIYVAASNGVLVYSPGGAHLGTIPTPRPPQNLAFAGPDRRTLYIVGRNTVSRVEMIASGPASRPK